MANDLLGVACEVDDGGSGREITKKKRRAVTTVFEALGQIISKKWKSLSVVEKKPYQISAKEEMDSYRIRMKDYEKNHGMETPKSEQGCISSLSGARNDEDGYNCHKSRPTCVARNCVGEVVPSAFSSRQDEVNLAAKSANITSGIDFAGTCPSWLIQTPVQQQQSVTSGTIASSRSLMPSSVEGILPKRNLSSSSARSSSSLLLGTSHLGACDPSVLAWALQEVSVGSLPPNYKRRNEALSQLGTTPSIPDLYRPSGHGSGSISSAIPNVHQSLLNPTMINHNSLLPSGPSGFNVGGVTVPSRTSLDTLLESNGQGLLHIQHANLLAILRSRRT